MTSTVADLVHRRRDRLFSHLAQLQETLAPPELIVEGKLTRMVGLTLEAVGCRVPVGGRCLIKSMHASPIESEIVGFSGESTYLMPIGQVHGLVPGARVVPAKNLHELPVGEQLLGRVLDGGGNPLDGKGALKTVASRSLNGKLINPLSRQPINKPLDVGVRAINGLLSIGRGQRMGLFAGSGVGKSVLLGMMARYTSADVAVIALIGERGREVREFVQEILAEQGLRHAVVIAVPADHSPLMRLHGAMYATTIAEYFRDQGKHVLLLMDSLTRFAQAQREIALSIGEPPATKGYPPSVFAKLPQLVERAGNGIDGTGSITAIYTVLAEGDDQNDPVVDAARAILDGHIVLSRSLAESGHFPAIDLESSVSRLMTSLNAPLELSDARKFRQIYARFQENKDIVNLGVYQKGADPGLDEAIEFQPRLVDYLQQGMSEAVSSKESMEQLQALFTQEVRRPGTVPS